MSQYQISNRSSGQDLGIYTADSPEQALDAIARDAGYDSYAALCAVAGAVDDLIVTEWLTHARCVVNTTR